MMKIFRLASVVALMGSTAVWAENVATCHDDSQYFPPDEWLYCQQLTSTLFMYYTPLEEEGNIMLGLHAVNETYGWTALALAGNGGMKGASQIVVRKQERDGANSSSSGATWIAEDRYSLDYTMPSLDKSQDVKLLFANQTIDDGETAWGVLLMMNSCDPEDYPILNVSVFMHWALGESHTFGYHGSRRGQFHANLLQAPTETPSTDGLDFVDFRMPNVSVVMGEGGSDPTNPYICSFFDLQVLAAGRYDVNNKTHVTRLSPILNEASKQYVHHMILYACLSDTESEEDGGGDDEAGLNVTTIEHLQVIPECQSMPEGCYEIKWPWAVGSEEIVLPEDVGLPIGEGQRWLVLQVHYYNPNLDEGVTDSSGVRAYVASDLREQDAGVMELDGGTGDWQHPAIPAGASDFALPRFVLPSECTSSVWSTPLNVLGVVHHMHLYGKKMEIFVQRDGRNLGPLRNEHHYDFQHQSLEPSTGVQSLVPGDVISVNCFYDTSSANSSVSFGDLTQQEMCFGVVMYYPRQQEQSFGYFPAEIDVLQCISPGTGDWAQASACAQNYFENVPAFLGFEDDVEAPFDAWTMCNSDWFETAILPFFSDIDLCPDCYRDKACSPEEVGIHAQTVLCNQYCGDLLGVSVYPNTTKTDPYDAAAWGCPRPYFTAPEIMDPPVCNRVGNLLMGGDEVGGSNEAADSDGESEEEETEHEGGREITSSACSAKSVWYLGVVTVVVFNAFRGVVAPF